MTGMRLDAGQVIEARAKEVQYAKERGVFKDHPKGSPGKRMEDHKDTVGR